MSRDDGAEAAETSTNETAVEGFVLVSWESRNGPAAPQFSSGRQNAGAH
jgi:hypothetical protein